uniref:Ribonuclease H-like domain, reverse transcriptase, RNA-dependent DNA polymerase n=1 Tax=Tanacetum cinerariifolium TaxID=118510 RepID=A0A6L2JW76_TANCI|nr:ribonuclease H-like domain, reverse transcriptase, RNA-dependent DNA polymerase [Tanacetum cinerariifolium]
MNIQKVIQNGNSLKRTRRDPDRGVIILPPMTAEVHIAVQRESKARTTLLQSIPDDHVADFHYMDDARDIWNAVKARIGEAEGLHKGSQDAGDAGEFALMGVTSELTLEDKIRVLSIELENTSNLLKHSERINANVKTAKKDLQTKLDNLLVQTKNENELGWDDSAFNVFTTNSEDVEVRPIFHRFAKTDSMKVVPPPLTGDYTSLSDHSDLDESQMSYGTKSSTSSDSKSVSNDFVSSDDSDKSSEVNTNDFASSDSSIKSSKPKPNDSTSCASTSSVSTSENEAEIESTVRKPIKEPIIVQDLPSFSCSSSDKNENTSRTSCTKNGYFNKKTGHFRKYASSISKLCFVCGSVATGKPKATPVPTGKPQAVTPVPTGIQELANLKANTFGKDISSLLMADNLPKIIWFSTYHITLMKSWLVLSKRLQSLPNDHVADFHYMDDARDIWNAVKARFGGNAKSKKMRKSMLKQEFLEFRISEAEGLHKGSQDAGDAGEFALMGVTFERVLQRNQLTREDNIRVLSIELENKSNLLKYSERINADVETAKKDLQTKLNNHLVQTKKWRNSSKNLFKLIDSSMSVRTKVGLGFTNCISENELGWDDSAFGVFTTNSEDMKARPIFHRFAKTDSMKVVPPPLIGDYTSLSDHSDLDESQMSYGTKSSTSSDSKSVSNDFVSCDDSDKSSEVNTNDFASSDSSVKSSKPKPNDSTSCAPTSSDLPSFSCIFFDKNENTSRTSCTKNGYFSKKAETNDQYDCWYWVGPAVRPQPVPTGKPKATPVPTGKPQAVTPVPTGKPKVKPVPTGKLKVTPVPTGKPQAFTPVPTDKRYTNAVIDCYDLVDSDLFSINEYDSLLEDLGFKDGWILFSYFRIPSKSLDEGLLPLVSDEDVLSLLWHVPKDREIEDDDVENENEALISKVAPLGEGCGTSIYGFIDSDSSDHPPWSSECKNEKRKQRWSDEFQFKNRLGDIDHQFHVDLRQDPKDKVKQVMQGDLHTLNDDDDDLLQLDDPFVWKHDNYHGHSKEEEAALLFGELYQLLKHVSFLNVKLRENVVGVAPSLVVVDAQVVPTDSLVVPVNGSVIALEEEIQRPRKRERDMEDESASAIVSFGRANKRRRLNPADNIKKGMKDKSMEANGLGFYL